MRCFLFRFLCTFLCCWCSLMGFGQAEEKKQSFFDMIYSPSIQTFELAFNIDSFIINKNKDEYQPAQMTWFIDKNQSKSWEIEVKPRGKFRLRTCVFPPVRVKMDKDELKNQGLKKHNKLKLVTHCVDGDLGDLIFREFLAYKIYEILTDTSFRVQLVKLTYQNTRRKGKIKNYGFFIEDEEELEEKFGGKVCDDCFGKPDSVFTRHNLNTLALFQYMIGNTDWSVKMVRNLKLMQSKDEKHCYVVPYDFDFSGLVNATSYAIPNRDYGLTTLRQRKFMGSVKSKEELANTIDHFKRNKEAILSFVDNFEHLRKSSRKDVGAYIKSFYKLIEDESFLTNVKGIEE